MWIILVYMDHSILVYMDDFEKPRSTPNRKIYFFYPVFKRLHFWTLHLPRGFFSGEFVCLFVQNSIFVIDLELEIFNFAS